MQPRQPLTGRQAFQKCVERIYRNGATVWFKFNHDKFFTGEAKASGEFSIWATEGTATTRKKTEFIADAYSFLSDLSQSKPGGVFYIPGQPTDFPLKDYCFASADIGAEMDDGTTQEQWQRVEWFSAVSSLEPGLVISSAGKSIHPHWFLDAAIPIAQATHLKKLLAIVLLSDPAVVNPHQPMRIAGFYRQEKGKEQTLDFWSDCRYTQEQFLQGLKLAFKAKGYVFPEHLSDELWRRIRRVLTTRGLTPEAKTSQIKEILALDETIFHPKPQQYDRPHDFKYNGDRIPLEVCLTKDDRKLIARGIGEGSRNISGYKLAANLIATARHLDSKRIAYQPDPRQLFDEFCARCSPAICSRGREAIWRSANRSNPTPSLGEDAIEHCIAAWQARQNPQPSKRDRTINRDEWHCQFGLPNWFRNQLAKLPKVFKGFGKPPEVSQPVTDVWLDPEPSSLPKIINYVPGEKLPTLQEYSQIGGDSWDFPTIRFKQGQRLNLIAELVALGYRHILDKSGTGSSKSYEVGLAEPEKFGVDRLWYFGENHRNPTVATVEANFTDMPVRHDGWSKGLIEDPIRKTALGNSHIRWAKKGETPTIPGNCHRAAEFHLLSIKGYEQVENSAGSNPICGGCHRAHECKTGAVAAGAGFRNEKAAIGKSDRIRSSLDSVFEIDQLSNDGAIYDEVERQFKATKTVEAQLADFDQVFAMLESELPNIHEQLKPFRLAIRPILAGQVKPTSETRYGWNDITLRDILGKPPTNLKEIIEQIEAIQTNLDEMLKEPDSLTLAGVSPSDRKDISRGTVKRVRSLVRQESYRKMSEDLRALPANWLIPFLEVWGELQPFGALRISNRTLTVTTRDTRHAEIARAMRFNVYLDSTSRRSKLSDYLRLPTERLDCRILIVEIEQEPADFSNLTIVQVRGLGLVGHDRSESLKARIAALKTALRKRHSDIGFIEHKQYAEEGDGWWFNHNRGSNEYKNRSAIATFGSPFPNIGSLEDLHSALYTSGLTSVFLREFRDNELGFSFFVKQHVLPEIAQTPGRLRANLRPQEQVTYYYCGDCDYDLEVLKNYYPGATIKQESAFDITPEAGTEAEQSHWRILNAARQLLQETGVALEKLRQATVAQIAGVTQGRISQVAAHYGGWNIYKKLLALLLESPYRNANTFELLDEEQKFFAYTYLPLAAEESPPDAINAMVITVSAYGLRIFSAILAATSIETRSRLLAALISRLEPALQQEFMVVASAVGK